MSEVNLYGSSTSRLFKKSFCIPLCGAVSEAHVPLSLEPDGSDRTVHWFVRSYVGGGDRIHPENARQSG